MLENLAPFPLVLRAESPDAELLRRARAGENAALETLVARFRGRVLNLAWQILRDRESAEDAAQEIFVRAFQKLPLFRGDSEFGTWLYRLALNFCLEKQRGQKRRAVLPPEETSHAPDIPRQIEAKILLEMALDALPENLRIVLMLREWHGQSYDEIAAITRIPVGTVRSRLHEARRQFRAIWEAQNEE